MPSVAGMPTGFSLSAPALASASWNFGDGATAVTSTGNTSHVYANPGAYTVDVAVVDARGRSASSSTVVTIPASPAPPSSPAARLILVLNCTAGRFIPCNVNVMTQDGVVITSQVTRVFWEWGDGTFLELFGPTAVTASHTYQQGGTYLLGVTVSTNDLVAITTRSFVIP